MVLADSTLPLGRPWSEALALLQPLDPVADAQRLPVGPGAQAGAVAVLLALPEVGQGQVVGAPVREDVVLEHPQLVGFSAAGDTGLLCDVRAGVGLEQHLAA